jgi:transcriptional regulator with XRE-family HTH domain
VFGVSTTTIGNWEYGDKLPCMENAINIATKTGVSVDWLLTGRGEKRARTSAHEELDISHLPKESRAAIRALVHSLEHQSDSSEDKAG